jgi:diadenylate cyclase
MLQQFLENLKFLSEHFRLQDIIDILLVWLVVYRLLLLIRRTGTVQMLSGLGLLAIAYILSIYFEFYTFNWILEKFFAHLFLIVVILFQNEIRRALAHIGSNSIFSDVSRVSETNTIEEIAKAVVAISQKGYGALIVVERDISIDYHIESGTELDSFVSSELLLSIFHPSSPIHDGATIIRNGKVFSAGCFLPLSKNPVLDRNLGTRHRAAIGLTEETDAVVFVVSEENKSIGIVSGGQLNPNVGMGEVRQALFDTYGLKHKG